MGTTMRKHLLAQLVVGTAVTATATVLMAGVALAHHPEIAATSVCVDGTAIINYTATAWSGWGSDPTNDSTRENPQVDVAFDGVLVETGAFSAPTYSFSGSAPAPAGKVAGDTVQVIATAVGLWGGASGGGQVASVTVTVSDVGCLGLSAGRFTGGGYQVRIGQARVTRGLTIHCDRLLSNNLQVNWAGNQFHMNEHLTTVECSDDPAIIQAPPPAPLDTLIGVGAGRYNGTAGYTVEFTLVDAGEPGSSDKAALRIYETANPGNVVLNVPLALLTGGNLQAHYDQPHK